MNAEIIEQGALRLPAKKRAHLAQKLLVSLDTLSESEIEEARLDDVLYRA